ncbi:MAG: acyl--CoA ligase [Acidimicrobiaceae bacterium]|nr:acyl--CoA ligase [Acidimicrobiaceae bacterium]
MTEADPAASRPELPYRPTIPDIVRRAAVEFGHDDYVVLPDRRMSFRDVEAASRRLAKQLLAAGAGKGTRIGLHLPNSPEWVVAFLGVSRIGALAMPFSSLYRPAELRTAMRVGDVSILLSRSRLLGRDHEGFLEEALPGLEGSDAGKLRIRETPYLRSIWLLGGTSRQWARSFEMSATGAEEPVDGVDESLLEAVEAEVTPADPLTAVFTSGSTADPKAVVHSQGAVLRKMAPIANAALNAMFGGRVLSLMPFFWNGGMQEVLAALQSGAALVTLERPDSAAALELAKRERVTSIKEAIVARHSLFSGVDTAREVPSLRPLPPRPWDGGRSERGDLAFGIGMTETFGLWTNVDGMDCRTVDPDTGAPVSDGEIGEFLVRGYCLMQGLYKREREDVFSADGFYATGDLGYTEHGKFYFRSRINDMIKTKGANVAPAEVEAVLNADPTLHASFVVGLPHDTYGEEVVAAVVPGHGETVEVDALLDRCRRTLSSYKVPRAIVVLQEDEVPRLSSGKLDRGALKARLDRATTGAVDNAET